MRRQFDDVLLGSIELFCLAAEIGSFTGAALAAGVTPAAVSRSVSRLEARLGVRLFVRTTRSIRLTEGGQAYHQQCRGALNQMLEAERELMGQQQAPSGPLRISIPTTYGHHRILPLLPEFRRQYPQVRVDIHLGNRNIDFVDEGYDMAIRVRAQPDSGLIARHLEDAALVVVATTWRTPAPRKPSTTWRNTNAFNSNCPAAADASPGCSMTKATPAKSSPRAPTSAPTKYSAA
jgi:DNA-binding transcriptional LysR family regulator